MSHNSTSAEQQAAESIMRAALARKLGVTWTTRPEAVGELRLDAYAATSPDGRPVIVEIFAHVGARKSGQTGKIARDMTKLLLAQRRLGECRMVIALATVGGEEHALAGWQGAFAKEFRRCGVRAA